MKPAGEKMRRYRSRGGFLVVRICCICCCWMAMGCDGWTTPQEGQQQQSASWLQLTRDNYTSELKEHEFSLCVVARPWCGESKRLMEEIQKAVKEDPLSFPGLQLFYVHTHRDRLLGQAILGDSTPPSFTLVRYGTRYKYTGRWSTSSIMASIRQAITVLRSDTVLGRIESPQDLEVFADSTDKAVILFEFCGWESKLQHEQRTTSSTDDGEGVLFEELSNDSGIAGRPEGEEYEVHENSNLDGDGKSSSKARGSLYIMQTGDQQIKTEPIVQIVGIEDHLPSFGEPLGQTLEESVQKLKTRIGDELDDFADCTNHDASYCISGSSFQNRGHTTLIHTNAGDNLETARAKDVEAEEVGQDQLLCSSEEYESFKVVYSNISELAADSILTPQRIRFATATKGEIASNVGISTQGRPWFLMYLINDFDRLPYSFNGLGTVEEFLFDHSPPLVSELEGEGHNSAASALLNDTPSVILFIDRMSNSPDVREKSKAALDTLQELSYHYASVANDGGQNGRQRRKKKQISEVQDKVAAVPDGERRVVQMVERRDLLSLLEKPVVDTGLLRKDDGNFVFQLLTDQHKLTKKIIGKDELVGSRDIFLAKVSQLKRLEEKVRQSLAVGADSWLIQVSRDQLQAVNQLDETLSHHSELDVADRWTLSNDHLNIEDHDSSAITANNYMAGMDGDKHQKSMTETAYVGDEEGRSPSEPLDSERGLLLEKGETGRSAIAYDEGESSTFRREPTNEDDIQHSIENEENQASTYMSELGFYFIDGDDPMMEKLARGNEFPALVIIDPERQAHYSLPSSDVLNETTLSSFVDMFLSGLLRRTVFSEPERPPPREPPRPPFVNQDFHEMYSVPRVTVGSFLEMVKGASKADERCNQFTFHESGREENEENGGNLTESAWDRDVLVLFTTPWCGFCKRMELVVREVYRSFQLVRSCENPSTDGINNSDDQQNWNEPTASRPARFVGGRWTAKQAVQSGRVDAVFQEPSILLQMDCSMNDCNDYLGEFFEEETYPAVVLFPARNKLSPVIYRGAPTVRGIFEFLNVHGAAASSAKEQEGNPLKENLLLHDRKVCTSTADFGCDAVLSSTSIKIGSGPGRGSRQEAATLLWELNSRQMEFGKHIEVGSILVASEKLLDASPIFANSIILIVSANRQGMIHGLVVNKPMAWKNVIGLDSTMEALLNAAAVGYGGPVVENHAPFLVLTRLQGLEEFTEVVPSIYCGFVPSKGRVLEMIHTGRLAAKDFWFFLGYSSWTWNQLQSELTGDLWQVRPLSDDLVKWPTQWTTLDFGS